MAFGSTLLDVDNLQQRNNRFFPCFMVQNILYIIALKVLFFLALYKIGSGCAHSHVIHREGHTAFFARSRLVE